MSYKENLILITDDYLQHVSKLADSYASQIWCEREVYPEYILIKLHYIHTESPSFIITCVDDLEYFFNEVLCFLLSP